MIFQCKQLLSEKVIQIKEAHYIQAYQGRQDSILVFSVTTARKKKLYSLI